MDDIKESKCSTCKFGICVKEMIIEGDAGPPPSEEEWEPDEQARPVWIGSHITSYCYWHPSGNSAMPVGHHIVTDCSKYEKN